MASRSTQSPRYNFEPIIYREPVRFPRGQRLAVLMYVNIEHVPFGSTALAHAVYPGTLGYIASHQDLWLTTGVEINNWYRASYLTPRRAA